MNRQAVDIWLNVVDWLKHRPWIIVPVLGLIPLLGIPLLNQVPSSQTVKVVSPSPASATLTLPSVTELPTPELKPAQKSISASVQKATPIPVPKPVPLPLERVQVASSAVSLSVDAAIQMRVLIQQAASSLSINTSGGANVVDVQSGKRLRYLPTNVSQAVQGDGKTILLGSTRLPSLIWIDPAADGLTFVGDRGYRGRLLIVSSDSRLWVVNYVNMQQYLYSVVGSEVSSSWPLEALKAQAVAARSYALTYHLKPVKRDLYDLGSDEYYQVYKGIESEANTTRKAVNGTSGEFVSYRGGVVESLYAATDDIVMDAFKGRGMSQIGALGLAEQGQSYRQILGAYYTGTGIGRVEMDIE